VEVATETCSATYQYPNPDPYRKAGAMLPPGSDTPELDRPPAYAGGYNPQTSLFVRDDYVGASCTGKTTYLISRP
jgi:hypothetical protein